MLLLSVCACVALVPLAPVAVLAQGAPGAGTAQYEPVPSFEGQDRSVVANEDPHARHEDTPVPAGDEPPAAQSSRHDAPDESEAPSEDECDPAYDEGCFDNDTDDFVDGASSDAQETSDALNGAAGAPALAPLPAEEAAVVPEPPPATEPPYGPRQYPSATVPSPEIGAVPAPQPAPRLVHPDVGPEPVAPTEPLAGTMPAQGQPSAPQPSPQPVPQEQGASVEDPRSTSPGPVPGRAIALAPVKDAPEGKVSREAERTEPEPGDDHEAVSRRGETDGGSRSVSVKGASVEEPKVAEQRELAAEEGGKSTVNMLGASAVLIAGAALVGRFLKR